MDKDIEKKTSDSDLSESFSQSISTEVAKLLSEYAELGLDSFMDDGLFRDIPFVSTAISIYKIGNSIRERHYIKKLIVFLGEINERIEDDEHLSSHIKELQLDSKKLYKELEYILVIIDRFIRFDKSKMLARLYLSYLRQLISWDEFIVYSEMIDRFLSADYSFLCSRTTYTINNHYGEDICLRLMAMGLIVEDRKESPWEKMGENNLTITSVSLHDFGLEQTKYTITDFGRKLVDIIGDLF